VLLHNGGIRFAILVGLLAGAYAHADPLTPPVRECDDPEPAWIWCDDFEDNRLSSYFEASMERRAAVGRDGSHAAVARFHPQRSEAGNLKVAFGRTPSAAFRPVDEGRKRYREIYWRMFVRQAEQWEGAGGDKLSRATILTDINRSQAMIAHVWSGSDPGPQASHLIIDPASGTDTRGRVRTARYNDFDNLRWLGARASAQPVFVPERVGAWICVEAQVRLNDPGKENGIFRLWIDDTPAAGRDDLDWVGEYREYGVNAVFFENYWNRGSPVEQERFMDNLVVSTERIGCGTQ